ncbi:MAG TPA: hypothetical protein VFB45_03975 [Pseudolabrys sp.]|nr:hypothetical protein [Pseudolabrys sp.]
MWRLIFLPLDIVLLIAFFHLLPVLFWVALWVSIFAIGAWILFHIIRLAVLAALRAP